MERRLLLESRQGEELTQKDKDRLEQIVFLEEISGDAVINLKPRPFDWAILNICCCIAAIGFSVLVVATIVRSRDQRPSHSTDNLGVAPE